MANRALSRCLLLDDILAWALRRECSIMIQVMRVFVFLWFLGIPPPQRRLQENVPQRKAPDRAVTHCFAEKDRSEATPSTTTVAVQGATNGSRKDNI